MVARLLVAMVLAPCAMGAWSPVNSNDFQCLDQDWVDSLPDSVKTKWYAKVALFDDRLGESPRYTVDDDRLTSAALELYLDEDNGFSFYGYGVDPDTEGRAVAGDSSNTGWVSQGSLAGAIVFEYNGWDSHYLASWVAQILLKERVGYNVATMATSNINYANIYSGDVADDVTLTTPPTHVNIEKWDLFHAGIISAKGYTDGLANPAAVGFFGQEGFYTNADFVNASLLTDPSFNADWWRAYYDTDAALDAINYTLSASEAESAQAACLGEADDDSTWSNFESSDCVDGFYVTDACAARAAQGRPCGILVINAASWASELMIEVVGLKLPLKIIFLGYGGAMTHVTARLDAGLPVLFYFWTPDVWMVQQPKAVRVTLPTPNYEVILSALEGTIDMRGDGAACDTPGTFPNIITSGDFKTTAPQAYALLESFEIPDSEMTALLARYDIATAADGEGWDGIAHYTAACDWVQNNYELWSEWMSEYVCDAGMFYDEELKDCASCPEGTAAPGTADGRFECEPCAMGFHGPAEGMQYCLACDSGTYTDVAGATSCSKCPNGAVCPIPECPIDAARCAGGTDVVVLPGNWRTDEESTNILECPGGEFACIGGNGTQLCADGYEGVKCAICQSGYTPDNALCLPCEGGEGDTVLGFVGFFLVVIVSLVAFVQFGAGPLQAKLLTVWRKYYNAVLDMAKFKVVWSTYQIISSIQGMLKVTWGEPFKTFSQYLSITQLNVLDMLPMGCMIDQRWSHYSQLHSSTLVPIAISLLIFLAYFVRVAILRPPPPADLEALMTGRRNDANHKASGNCEELEVIWRATTVKKLRAQHINMFLLVTFMVLPTTSVSILRTFDCEKLDTGDSWLVADLALQCYTPAHDSACAYAWVMVLLYPIGIPSMYLALLYRMKGRINPTGDTVQAKLSARRADKVIKPVSFLFKYYQPGCWWFEVADALRRVAMIGGLVFVRSPPARACCGFGLALMSLLLFRESEPFLTPGTNALATVAQWQLIVTYFSAILVISKPFNYSMFSLMLGLVIANIVLVVGAVTLQYLSGSAQLEAELKMMEMEFREAETKLTITEMRSDFNNLQLKLGLSLAKDDATTKLPATIRGPSASISTTADIQGATSRKSKGVLGKVFKMDSGKALEVSFNKAHYPCMVISLTNLMKLSEIITHEQAMASDILEELTATSRAPSCAYTFFISQNWESRTSPDNASGTKLRWLQNMKRHLQIDEGTECWIWWDLICVPQHNRENQKKAIASLCHYATLCSRFLPLVRNEQEWLSRYGKVDNCTLPQGTLETYLQRGWCRLEIIAALCPKRFKSSGKFRPGPLNLRFRYHQDPDSAGIGPAITVADLLDPREADFTNPADVAVVEPVLYAIAKEYEAYEQSGSRVWDATIDVLKRPAWFHEIIGKNAPALANSDTSKVQPAPVTAVATRVPAEVWA